MPGTVAALAVQLATSSAYSGVSLTASVYD